jgi:hypothetical protein
MTEKQSGKTSDDGLQGEGDYAAARRFREAEEAFVKDGPVKKKAREAADALEGPEGADLEAARRTTAAGETHLRDKEPRRADDHPHDADLDHGLDETFPASDPVSISPGSD